jgi:RNA polymerase sigma factor (TIGR02999 family)
MSTHGDISELLAAADGNDPEAWDRLMGLVYGDLKRIAHAQMGRIAPNQTLSTTVLVHEAFEKLAASEGLKGADRTGFYAVCACAMRQIIIDHYRKRSARKRNSIAAADYDQHERYRVNPEGDEALERLGQVLEALVRRDERLAKVFEMRYFAGMTDPEIADRLDLSVRTVQRLARRARAWVVAALEP